MKALNFLNNHERKNNMIFEEATRRYQNDPKFNKIVSMFEMMIMNNDATFYELNDALIFTMNKLAMENRVTIFNVPQKDYYDYEGRNER